MGISIAKMIDHKKRNSRRMCCLQYPSGIKCIIMMLRLCVQAIVSGSVQVRHPPGEVESSARCIPMYKTLLRPTGSAQIKGASWPRSDK